MKSKLIKSVTALMLCMVMVLSAGTSALADSAETAETDIHKVESESAVFSEEEEMQQEEPQTESQPDTEITEDTEAVNIDEEQSLDEASDSEREDIVFQKAIDLRQEIKDKDGQIICNITAHIPEGTFETNTSELSMEVREVESGMADIIRDSIKNNLQEGKELGAYFMYNIAFKVDGETAEPGREIKIKFEQKDFLIEDTKKASVFYCNNVDFQTGYEEAELIKIPQKSEIMEALHTAGRSIENADDYDLTEITLREDGTADTIQTEGRHSAVYGCYLEEDNPQAAVTEDSENSPEGQAPQDTGAVQELNYKDDNVSITVSADKPGVIPENAILQVVPIEKMEISDGMTVQAINEANDINEKYDMTVRKLEEESGKNDKVVEGFIGFDICFLVDGQEIEPSGNVRVAMNFAEEVIPEEATETAEVQIKHLAENKTDNKEITVETVAGVVDVNEENAVEAAEFTVSSFSSFVITWIFAGTKIDVEYVDQNGDTLSHTSFTNGIKFFDRDEWIDLADNKYTPKSVTISGIPYVFSSIRKGDYNGEEIRTVQYRSKSPKGEIWYTDAENNEKQWEDETKKIVLVYNLTQITGPTLVPTVDSTKNGITMKMIDYPENPDNRDFPSPFTGAAYGQGFTEEEKKGVKTGILSKTLNLATGYPDFVRSRWQTPEGESLERYFRDAEEVNRLFLESEYTKDGHFYYYNSEQNAASLRSEEKEFKVYKQLMTPLNRSDAGTNYVYQRGNFFPYNTIDRLKDSELSNLYDAAGDPLLDTDERKGDPLYLPDQPTNYHFGMELSADFLQNKNGIYDKHPMRYEFMGDDDMWIYIDGVLVLDMGGCHDPRKGWIDFSTGEVWVQGINGNKTKSIKTIFEDAGKTDLKWKDVKNADGTIIGHTFEDYTQHSFRMWYMERGAGASNLSVKFNLPVIQAGTVEVRKELSNTDKEDYANVDFAFQVFAQEIVNEGPQGEEIYGPGYVPLDGAVYMETEEPVEFKTIEINGKSYENVFYLKPDEAALFRELQANRKYYVVEVDVNTDEFNQVKMNEEICYPKGGGGNQPGEVIDAKSQEAAVSERSVVVCENTCSDQNSRKLLITKQMAQGHTSEDKFAFQIFLEGQSGKFTPYLGGYYLQDAAANYWTYEGGNLVNKGPEAAVCGQSSEDGKIAGIPAGFTVSIAQLLSGTEFLIDEVDLDDTKYDEPEKVLKEGTCDIPSIEGADGAIKLGTDAEVGVINRLNVNKEWKIIKTSSSDERLLLKGAKFTLTSDSKVYYGISDETGIIKWYTDENRALLVNHSDMEAGVYKLKEIQAPSGYAVSAEEWTVTLNSKGAIPVITGINGEPVTPEIVPVSPESSAQIETHIYHFENTPVYELPETGGRGVFWYLIGGTLLMLASALILYKNKCKGVPDR